VSAVVSDDAKNITLNIYDEMVMRLLDSFSAENAKK